jgi:hypothetical protein
MKVRWLARVVAVALRGAFARSLSWVGVAATLGACSLVLDGSRHQGGDAPDLGVDMRRPSPDDGGPEPDAGTVGDAGPDVDAGAPSDGGLVVEFRFPPGALDTVDAPGSTCASPCTPGECRAGTCSLCASPGGEVPDVISADLPPVGGDGRETQLSLAAVDGASVVAVTLSAGGARATALFATYWSVGSAPVAESLDITAGFDADIAAAAVGVASTGSPPSMRAFAGLAPGGREGAILRRMEPSEGGVRFAGDASLEADAAFWILGRIAHGAQPGREPRAFWVARKWAPVDGSGGIVALLESDVGFASSDLVRSTTARDPGTPDIRVLVASDRGLVAFLDRDGTPVLWEPYRNGGTADSEGPVLALEDFSGAKALAVADSFAASNLVFVASSTGPGGTHLLDVACAHGTPGMPGCTPPRAIARMPFGMAHALDATSLSAQAASSGSMPGVQVAIAFAAADAAGSTAYRVGVAWLTRRGGTADWTLDGVDTVGSTGGMPADAVALAIVRSGPMAPSVAVHVAWVVGDTLTVARYERCGIDG